MTNAGGPPPKGGVPPWLHEKLLLVRFQAHPARATGRPVDEIADDMRRGPDLDAGEAQAYGLIDTISDAPR